MNVYDAEALTFIPANQTIILGNGEMNKMYRTVNARRQECANVSGVSAEQPSKTARCTWSKAAKKE